MLVIGRKKIGLFCLVLLTIYYIYNHFFVNTPSAALRYLYSLEKLSENDCEAEMKKLNDKAVAQDDTHLVRVIQQCFLDPPSYSPYNLTNPNLDDYSQGGQALYVDKLLNHAENGFFVECGAHDGEYLSNTLFFEKHRKWTGLLIEPVAKSYNILRTKHRKSLSVEACLSKSQHPVQMVMNLNDELSRLTDDQVSKYIASTSSRKSVVQCFPFYSLLLALGRTKIDFFSLDIEGDELTVLKTIPWHKVDIKVIVVEYNHIREGVQSLIQYMSSNNYIALPMVRKPRWQDVVFVKKGSEYNSDFTF